jgi:hypothetical protein
MLADFATRCISHTAFHFKILLFMDYNIILFVAIAWE